MKRKYDVICAGLSTVDIIVGTLGADVFKRDTTYLDTLSLQIGGDAVNQAVVLSHLGCYAGLMTLIGNDYFGKFLSDMLIKQKVDCSLLHMEPYKETTVSVVLLDEVRERHFAARRGCMDEFGLKHINFDAVTDTKIVSIGSNLALKSLDGAATCELFSYARKHGAITVADYSIGKGNEDVDRKVVSDMFQCTDYILPSYAEASLITGEHTPQRIVKVLREMGANHIILKLGAKGCYVCADGIEKMIPALPASVIDTTGAGDCFVAGFLYGLVNGFSIEKCAVLGCAAGAIGVEAIGANTAIKSEAQLLARIKGIEESTR